MIHTGAYYKMSVYLNTQGKTAKQIKQESGCDTILSGVLFETDGSGLLCLDQKINGKILRDQAGDFAGITWSKDTFPKTATLNTAQAYENFISSCEVQRDTKRGRTAIAFNTAQKTYTVLCTSDKSGAMTWTAARDAIASYGDVSIVLDGGGSSRCICPTGEVTTSYARDTLNKTYILIWEKKESASKTPVVCLDPGHGDKELNCSPDKSYYEHEFALDMGFKVKALLEKHGIKVIMTRTDSSTPGLRERCNIANTAKADLYCSLHTNAVAGNKEDIKVKGLATYIYKTGGSRNVFANAIIKRMEAAGIQTFGSKIYTSTNLSVLKYTNMPAALIEYGFHTNPTETALLKSDAYRNTLAKATAQAICDYFNITYIDTTPDKPVPIKPCSLMFSSETDAKIAQDLLSKYGCKTIIT